MGDKGSRRMEQEAKKWERTAQHGKIGASLSLPHTATKNTREKKTKNKHQVVGISRQASACTTWLRKHAGKGKRKRPGEELWASLSLLRVQSGFSFRKFMQQIDRSPSLIPDATPVLFWRAHFLNEDDLGLHAAHGGTHNHGCGSSVFMAS